MCAAAAAEEDEDLGEIPDEFMDPILSTLMRDPVMLPSGTSVDRPTILRHLLSDPKDPFNRQPLTVADLKDDVVLRDQINAFVALRRSQKKDRAAMDVDQ